MIHGSPITTNAVKLKAVPTDSLEKHLFVGNGFRLYNGDKSLYGFNGHGVEVSSQVDPVELEKWSDKESLHGILSVYKSGKGVEFCASFSSS